MVLIDFAGERRNAGVADHDGSGGAPARHPPAILLHTGYVWCMVRV